MRKVDELHNLPPRVLEEVSSRLENRENAEEFMSRVVTRSGKRLSELSDGKSYAKFSTKDFLKKHLAFLGCL